MFVAKLLREERQSTEVRERRKHEKDNIRRLGSRCDWPKARPRLEFSKSCPDSDPAEEEDNHSNERVKPILKALASEEEDGFGWTGDIGWKEVNERAEGELEEQKNDDNETELAVGRVEVLARVRVHGGLEECLESEGCLRGNARTATHGNSEDKGDKDSGKREEGVDHPWFPRERVSFRLAAT